MRRVEEYGIGKTGPAYDEDELWASFTQDHEQRSPTVVRIFIDSSAPVGSGCT